MLIWDGLKVHSPRIEPNENVLVTIRSIFPPPGTIIAIEMVSCYGMPVGKEVFETCLFIGQLIEICHTRGFLRKLIYRRDIKLHHCGTARAKDANIRQALIDKYGEPSTNKNQGRTYGLKSHLWSAFAVAAYVSETTKEQAWAH